MTLRGFRVVALRRRSTTARAQPNPLHLGSAGTAQTTKPRITKLVTKLIAREGHRQEMIARGHTYEMKTKLSGDIPVSLPPPSVFPLISDHFGSKHLFDSKICIPLITCSDHLENKGEYRDIP